MIRKDTALAVLLVGITAAHLGYRLQSTAPAALAVAKVAVGERVGAIRMTAAHRAPPGARGLPESGCRLIVAYSSTCQFCHVAASRESALRGVDTTGASPRLPVVWIASEKDAGARSFGSRIAASSWLVSAPGAWQTLKIDAVPAAVLIGADDRVRGVWVYQGSESLDSLARTCA